MEITQDTWQLAKLMLEQHGQNAMHGARAVSVALRNSGANDHGADWLDIVRAMDFLLSDDGMETIH